MEARSKYCLVILTTHFGTNFSGGSTATCEIFSRIEAEFSEVIVVGTQLGKHPFDAIKFLPYSNWLQAILILYKLKSKEAIFYGDFYNSFLFVLLNLPFFFTYHDNWPEQAKVSFRNKLNALFYVPIYKCIFKKAQVVFTVSEFKYEYIKQYTKNAALVYNGFNHIQHQISTVKTAKQSVLMVGNIDSRKYSIALKLFQLIKDNEQGLTIDIYGHVRDKKLAQKLQTFQFVELKGYHNQVPYERYGFMLHTSVIENFPLVFCESIHHQVPVVTFDVGGSSELIGGSTNGLLIKPYDVQEMAAQLPQLLTGKINIKMDTTVLQNKSWRNAAKQYLEYII